MAYRQYTWFTHGYFGRKQRRVIPSCVVARIKQLYPEANADAHRGFEEAAGHDDDDDDFFFYFFFL